TLFRAADFKSAASADSAKGPEGFVVDETPSETVVETLLERGWASVVSRSARSSGSCDALPWRPTPRARDRPPCAGTRARNRPTTRARGRARGLRGWRWLSQPSAAQRPRLA